MAYTYILWCADGTFYVGSTRSLAKRLVEHDLGVAATCTRRRRPVRLVWSEEHENVGAAFAREKQIQGWSRAKRIALFEARYDDLPGLARRRR